MDERQLKTMLHDDEAKHKKYLFWHNFGEFIKNYGKRGFWPFGDGAFYTVLRFMVHALLYSILFAITRDPLIGLILYAIVNGALLGIGFFLELKFEKKLDKLKEKCVADHRKYYLQQCENYNLYPGSNGAERIYANRMSISAFAVNAVTRYGCSSMEIYPMENALESGKFHEKRHNLGTMYSELSKNIASVTFNNKFRVITEKGSEQDCMKILTPSVQLGLIKSSVMKTFNDVEVLGNQFTARTNFHIAFPTQINLYDWKALHKYYVEINTYCFMMNEKINQVYSDLMATYMFPEA